MVAMSEKEWDATIDERLVDVAVEIISLVNSTKQATMKMVINIVRHEKTGFEVLTKTQLDILLQFMLNNKLIAKATVECGGRKRVVFFPTTLSTKP